MSVKQNLFLLELQKLLTAFENGSVVSGGDVFYQRLSFDNAKHWHSRIQEKGMNSIFNRIYINYNQLFLDYLLRLGSNSGGATGAGSSSSIDLTLDVDASFGCAVSF